MLKPQRKMKLDSSELDLSYLSDSFHTEIKGVTMTVKRIGGVGSIVNLIDNVKARIVLMGPAPFISIRELKTKIFRQVFPADITLPETVTLDPTTNSKNTLAS